MKISIVFLAALLLPGLGFAQAITVKPGLWEHSMDVKSDSGNIELALQLARMQMTLIPQQQRQMLEEVIQAQGINVDWINQSFQNCISEEEASSGNFRFAEEGGCEFTKVEEKGFVTDIAFVCAQGQGNLALADGIEYTGKSSMTLNYNGLIEHATATHSGRWLGSSCAALGQ